MWEEILKNDRLLSTVERIIDDMKTFDLSEQERKEADEIISQMGSMAMKNDAEGFNEHLQEFNRFYASAILKKAERTRPKPSPLPEWFDEDDKEITTSNALSASRIVNSDIAGKMLDLHFGLQRLGTNILESAVKLHNENIGPNSKQIDVSPDEFIKLLHRYQLAMKGYVQRSEDY